MKAATYQKVKDSIYEWVQRYEKFCQSGNINSAINNADDEMDEPYTIHDTMYIRRIYKPVDMNMEKIKCWFKEFGYNIKYNNTYTYIPVKKF